MSQRIIGQSWRINGRNKEDCFMFNGVDSRWFNRFVRGRHFVEMSAVNNSTSCSRVPSLLPVVTFSRDTAAFGLKFPLIKTGKSFPVEKLRMTVSYSRSVSLCLSVCRSQIKENFFVRLSIRLSTLLKLSLNECWKVVTHLIGNQIFEWHIFSLFLPRPAIQSNKSV